MSTKIKLNFLGTSAQIPTVKRNHTAILLTYNEENILVDCGEGTQRQFRKAKLNPCKITKILITHIHGDHIYGLPGILSTLNLSEYKKTLHIYCPKGTKKFLEHFLYTVYTHFKIEIEEVSGKFFENNDFYLEAEKMQHGTPTNAYNFVKKGTTRIDKKKLKASKIPEGPLLKDLKLGKNITYNGKKYLAKNLTYSEGDLKISFVLDTKMNDLIAPFVKGADILVCESSFEGELDEKARDHLHLTSENAANIAKKVKVGKLFLTHISQRYENDLKKLLTPAKKIFKESFIVNDLDVVEFEK